MYQKRIERGMAWLDQHFQDWVWRVNLDTLALSNCDGCVLGQLCGFGEGKILLVGGLKNRRERCQMVTAHGFSLYGDTELEYANTLLDVRRAYTPLTAEWKEAIRKKRTTSSPSSSPLSTACEAVM